MVVKNGFRKFLVLAMTFTMILSFFSSAVYAASDTSGHWAEKEINEWVENGLINGYSDGSFKPNSPISRVEFIALVNRAFEFTELSENGFKDVTPNDWYYSEVLKAKAVGYIGGYEDGTIKPNNNITRQEVAAILTRLLQVENASTGVDQFKDKESIPEWSKGIIGGIVAQGLMQGFNDGTFKPINNTTRAEAVVILDRALAGVSPVATVKEYNKAGTYGPEKGLETVNGSVEISASDVTLKNMVIEGDLTIAEEVGNGEVFLKGVTVKGNTYVNGGGENSIHFEDTVLLSVIVDKKDGTVRIVASGNTTVQQVTLQSSAKVEQTSEEGVAFKAVTLSEALPKDSKITLIGEFDSVEIFAASIAVEVPRGLIKDLKVAEGASGMSINLEKDAKIVSLVLDAAVKVLGSGVIENAEVNVNGTTFAKQPNNTDYADGVTKPSSSGGGGNSSPDDDDDGSDKDNGEGETPDDGQEDLGKITGTVVDGYVRVNPEINVDSLYNPGWGEEILFSLSLNPNTTEDTFIIETNGILKDELSTSDDIVIEGLPDGLTYDAKKNSEGQLEILIGGKINYLEEVPLNGISDEEDGEGIFDLYTSIHQVFDGFPLEISVTIKPTAVTNKGALESDKISLQINPPTTIDELNISSFTTGDSIELQFSDSVNVDDVIQSAGIALVESGPFSTGDSIIIYNGAVPDLESEETPDLSQIIGLIVTNQNFVDEEGTVEGTIVSATVDSSTEGVLSFTIGDVIGDDNRVEDFSITEPFEYIIIPGRVLTDLGIMINIPPLSEEGYKEEEIEQAFYTIMYYVLLSMDEFYDLL